MTRDRVGLGLVIYFIFNTILTSKGNVMSKTAQYHVTPKVSDFNWASSDWTHWSELKENVYQVHWRNSEPDEDGQRWILMEVSVEADEVGGGGGYVAIGFSPHGGMNGADMAIAWMDASGKPQLMDFHGIGNESPVLDDKQDYHLINMGFQGNWLTVTFLRRWDTCDQNDMKITDDTIRLIWSYSRSTVVPSVSGGRFLASPHGPTQRGARSVVLTDAIVVAPEINEINDDAQDAPKFWDARVNNVSVNVKDTYYHCQLLKFRDLDRKHHMIGWKPIIEKGNENILHHMILVECSVPDHKIDIFEDYHSTHPGGACYTPNMPPDWGRYCVGITLAWLLGSEGEMLPEHVGAPLGQNHGGATYFMLEMHYENPAHRITTDSSGIRIFYSDKLRKNDGGTMLVGYRHSPFLLVPPNQDNFMIHGICGSECTSSKEFPATGINITHTVVHMHLAGRKIRLRHFRNGTELPLIAEDNYYDFNYQQSRRLKQEITILPGDSLVTECEYSSKKLNGSYVIGGLATTQEMAQTIFFYYPRTNLTQCTSQYEFHDFFKALRIDSIDEESQVLKALKMPYDPHPEQEMDIGDNAKALESLDSLDFSFTSRSVFDLINITRPEYLRGVSVHRFLKRSNWTNEMGAEVEKSWRDGKHYQFCSAVGSRRILLKDHIIKYPEISKPLVHSISEVCRREELLKMNDEPASNSNFNSAKKNGSHRFTPPVILLTLLSLLILCIV